MKTVSVREARATISALLDRAEAGESTLVIRNSKPSAVLTPVPPRGVAPNYDPEEIRWYRARGSSARIGFTGAANATFLRCSRDERAQMLAILSGLAADAPLVVTTL